MLNVFYSDNLSEGYDNINFDIVDLPLIAKHDGVELSTGQKAIVRVDNGKILGIHSNSYNLIKNTDLADKLKPFSQQGYEIERLTNYEDKKFKIELVDRDKQMIVADHLVHPRIVVENSYDGSIPLKASAGYYVQVCSNGAIVGNKFYNINHKHNSKFVNNFEMFDSDYVFEMLENFSLKVWRPSLSNSEYDDMIKEICKGIPKPTDKPSMTELLLNKQYYDESRIIKHQDEFAMFMAATNLSTHGYKQGIPYSYMRIMDKNISEIFLNNIFSN